ncbi:MAG: serine/threonine protein kinase [Gemmataceae bacterium]
MSLGACETFVVNLRRSNLVERGQLEQLLGDFMKQQPLADPKALSQYLVQNGVLSQFQAERIMEGKPLDMVLGPYVLVDVIGSGSTGTVYSAISKNDEGGDFAVKVLPRRSLLKVIAARRLVRAFEQCEHPSVVRFMDVGTAGSTNYLVWPLVEGTTLDKIVQEKGKLWPGRTARYMKQVAEGLVAAQAQKLIHGFVKPSNIMIGPREEVYILDFGIGALLVASEGESIMDTMSMANAQASGLDCVSPESIVDPTCLTSAGDQYSLGCVLYYCLTGQYPFSGDTAVAKMMAHQSQQPTPIRQVSPEVPPELASAVETMMAKTPEQRFSSLTEIFGVLDQASRMSEPKSQMVKPAARPQPQLPTREQLMGGGSSPAVPALKPLEAPAAPPPAPAPAAAAPAAPSRPAPAPAPAQPRVAPAAQAPVQAPPRPMPAPQPQAAPPRPQPAAAPRPQPAAPAPAPQRAPAPVPQRAPAPVVEQQAPAPQMSSTSSHSSISVRVPSGSSTDRAILFLVKAAARTYAPLPFMRRLSKSFGSFLLGFTKKGRDIAECSVIAPSAVPQDKSLYIHVLVHLPLHTELAYHLAEAFKRECRPDVRSLKVPLPRGAAISFHLSIPGLELDKTVLGTTWHGTPELVSFKAHVPAGLRPSQVVGNLTASVNGAPVGRIDFTIDVVAANAEVSPEPIPVGHSAQAYE